MATSGTVGQTTITTGQILDHAFRRCKLLAQQITNELIDTAKRLLWMKLTALNARGILMSAIDTQLFGLTAGQANIQTRAGNIYLLNANLREVQRIDGSPSVSGGGMAGNAYDQDLTTACTNTSPNGSITIGFTTPSALTQVGFLPAASGSWNYLLQWSADSVTWTTFQTVTAQAIIAGQWMWYDVDAVPLASAFQIVATNGTTLSVFEIVCANTPSDIPMGTLDRDTWTQLPNKTSPGRPTIYYWDRRITTPIIHIWPVPDSTFPLTFLMVLYIQRQLQDVGKLPQGIELPDRWYLPVIADLAAEVAAEAKEVDADTEAKLIENADRLMRAAWDAETDGAPVRLLPNIGVYTK